MSGVRRPAAADPHGRRRGGGARPPVRRRPAAALDEKEGGLQDRWARGEEILASEFSPGLVPSGSWIRSTQATYFEAPCEFAGTVDKVVLQGGETELGVVLTGTSSEELLRYASGVTPPLIRVHLCSEGCDQKRTNVDLVHLHRFRQVVEGAARQWEENLKGGDENQELRRRQAEWEERQNRDKQITDERSDSRAREDKKKKEKKKDKKKEKRNRNKKVGGKALARKKAEDLYAGTGLDPDPKVRRLVKRRAKKRLKKSKVSSSSSSRSSSSSSSVEVELGLLEDRNKVQLLSEVAPGVLTEESLQHMKTYVVQASGSTWSLDVETLPPIMSQYMRHYIAPRASGGILREAVTLSYAADLLLQSRPAEALDVLNQRLKSLEMTISGQPWSTSQKIELAPHWEATMASRAEVQVAQKEAKLDSQAKGGPSSWDKGKAKSKGKEKGKEKGKGGKSKEDSKKAS